MARNTTQSQQQQEPNDDTEMRAEPLAEVHRRIVHAHAVLAESVGGDRERIGWVLREMMETLRYIDSVSEPSPKR
jgi:hypothetical protein